MESESWPRGSQLLWTRLCFSDCSNCQGKQSRHRIWSLLKNVENESNGVVFCRAKGKGTLKRRGRKKRKTDGERLKKVLGTTRPGPLRLECIMSWEVSQKPRGFLSKWAVDYDLRGGSHDYYVTTWHLLLRNGQRCLFLGLNPACVKKYASLTNTAFSHVAGWERERMGASLLGKSSV